MLALPALVPVLVLVLALVLVRRRLGGQEQEQELLPQVFFSPGPAQQSQQWYQIKPNQASRKPRLQQDHVTLHIDIMSSLVFDLAVYQYSSGQGLINSFAAPGASG